MSGHSKWANIKHKKASVDAKRGVAFTKVVQLISAAVRKGSGCGDPDMNPSLRLAVEKARAVNMPKDNIDRAIKKATGEGSDVQFAELTYEGYGQGGVAILVEALTDNRNRTTPEVRKIFDKGGGNMGEMGCVAWMFKKTSMIQMPAGNLDEDALVEMAMDIGADDVELSEGTAIFKAAPDAFALVLDALKEHGHDPKGDFIFVPEPPMMVDNIELAEKVLKLMDAIEDHEDVQSVTSNMEFSEEVSQKLQQD
jgi:YebC/PmpR family DNA-binding regulatory protein